MALFYIFVGLILPTVFCQDGPLVVTQYGSIRGQYATSFSNKTYSIFRSVPYAQPPVGNLRFQDPVPLTPWSNELQANRTTLCPQIIGGNYQGEEDCLYLNIYVPSRDPTSIQKKFKVDVYFHEGLFMLGYGEQYTGVKFVMDIDLVFVTINYRLGALGFMSTQDENLPGNIGMKDQVAALKWIRENIHLFGGDITNMNLLGLEAGAASIHYHYLSPMSTSLFNAGYSFSGTALSPWALQERPLEKARRLGRAVNCNQNSTRSMVDCMKNKTARLIVEKTNEVLQVWAGNPTSPFAPVIEPYHCNPRHKTFLPEHPYDLMSKGRIQNLPWMTSFVQDEGSFPAATFLNDNRTLPELNRRWEVLCPYLFDFHYTLSIEQQRNVCRNIRSEYFGNETISNSTYMKLVNALSDRLIITSTVKAAQLQAQKVSAPVFVYKFNYTLETLPHFSVLFSTAPARGVGRGDDNMLLLALDRNNITSIPSENDRKMQNIMFTFFVTFAWTANPSNGNYVWTPVARNGSLNYMYVESPNLVEMRSDNNLGNAGFWNRIPFNENERYRLN